MKKFNPALVILSILLPIVGYVLFFVKKEEDPDAASAYLWAAIGGTIVGVILTLS